MLDNEKQNEFNYRDEVREEYKEKKAELAKHFDYLEEKIARMRGTNKDLRNEIVEVKRQRDYVMQENKRLRKSISELRIELMLLKEDVELKEITVDKAKSILFSEDFESLIYVKDENVYQVTQEKRRWAFENAEKYDAWYIKDDASDLVEPVEVVVEDEDRPETSFHDRVHEVNILELPAYLLTFRHEMGLKTEDVQEQSGINAASWSSYELGRVKPRNATIKKIEEYCNIKVDKSRISHPVKVRGFAERLKSIVEDRGFEQAEVVRGTNIASGSISTYMNGTYMPLPQTLNVKKLADFFDTSVSYLLTGTDKWN